MNNAAAAVATPRRVGRSFTRRIEAVAVLGATVVVTAILTLLLLMMPSWRLLRYSMTGVNVCLAALAVAGAGWAVALAVTTRRGALIPEASVDELVGILERDGASDAAAFCKTRRGPLFRIARAGLLRIGWGWVAALAAVDERGREEVLLLRHRTDLLLAFARLAPLFGTLGFVAGEMNCLRRITIPVGLTPNDSSQILASALLLLAWSLAVMIPCLAAHRFLANRAQRAGAEVRGVARAIVEAASAREPQMNADGTATAGSNRRWTQMHADGTTTANAGSNHT